MKIIKIGSIVIGLAIILIFALSDFIGLGDNGVIGAAQILGMQFGAIMVIIGIGLLTIDWSENSSVKTQLGHQIKRIADFSPTFWVVATFLILYVVFFIYPVFFTKLKIQYFIRYIPYEWVAYIGNDIVWTVDRINNWLVYNQSPYKTFFYPPLTAVLFAPFIILGYPGYYKLIVIITILSFFVATCLIPLSVRLKENYTLILLLFLAGLFSYGFQFELDRGQFNLIAFAACVLAIYIFHFQYKYRYFAYLLFSLAINLKMYPIIFIGMFIKDWRDWKNNFKRLFGLGLFNLSLLFILGYQTFLDFFRNITNAQLYFESSRREDLSIKGFVYNLTTDGFGLISVDKLPQFKQLSGLFESLFFVLFGVCILSILIYAYIKKQKGFNPYLLVICTIGALIIPSASVDYKLPMLIAPMAITLSNLPKIIGRNKKIIATATIIFASMAFWSTFYPFTIKPYILSRNFPALMVILITITSMNFLAPYTIEKRYKGLNN